MEDIMRPDIEDLPFISIIVPVRNEEKFIAQLLAWLLTQDYPTDRYEVIVADGRSDDRTVAIVTELMATHTQLRWVDNPKRWSSAGRNAAILASQGEIVVLVDGHCDVGNAGYLRRVASAFAISGAACLARPQPLQVRDATALQRAIAQARQSFAGHNPSSHIYSETEGFINPQSSAVAYKRFIFTQIGLFDESFDACEDVEFNHRVHQAGLTCFFTPTIGIHYYPRRTLKALAYQMYRYGVGRVRLVGKHPSSFSWAAIAPGGLLVWLAVTLLVGIGWPLVWLGTAMAALAYGTFIAAGVVTAGRRLDWAACTYLPLVFVAIHAGFGWGTLVELGRQLTGRRRNSGTIRNLSVPHHFPRKKLVSAPTLSKMRAQ
jgi:glycosyltransferase involved in cell wall biosynthesis